MKLYNDQIRTLGMGKHWLALFLPALWYGLLPSADFLLLSCLRRAFQRAESSGRLGVLLGRRLTRGGDGRRL